MTRRSIPARRRGCLPAVFLFLVIGLAGVILVYRALSFHRWTDQERQAFGRQCALKDTAVGVWVRVTGAAFADSLHVQRIHGGRAVDSFSAGLRSRVNGIGQPEFEAVLPEPLILRDTHELRVDATRTFMLTDMRMTTRPQFTMFNEGHGCGFGSYRVDTGAVRERQGIELELSRRSMAIPDTGLP